MQRSALAASTLPALGFLALSLRAGSVGSAAAVTLGTAACEAGRAYAARELAALERLRAADYVQTDLRGGVLTRAEWLSLVKNRPSTLSIECENIEVRFDGATALVTGGWTYTNHKPGADVVSAPAGPRGGGRSTGRGSGTPSRTPTSILRPTSALRLRQR